MPRTVYRYFVIVNPVAGGGRAGRLWPKLEAGLLAHGLAFEHVFTKDIGHATHLAAQAYREGYRHFVAVGGDGTLQEMVNGLPLEAAGCETSPPVVGWIPAGTGNDFARSVGLPADPLIAVDNLVHGYPRAVDLGRVNGRRFLNVAGVGFDAKVADRVNRFKRKVRGALPYLVATGLVLARYRNTQVRVTVDGQTRVVTALLVAVGNGQYYGGGLMVCPRASYDDGLLDVCIGGDLNRRETLRALAKIFRGKHLGLPKIQYLQGRELRIDGSPEMLAHADGQVIGGLPVTVEIRHGALTLILPVPENRPLESQPTHGRVGATHDGIGVDYFHHHRTPGERR